ncbi:MAG: glycosyl hydrolase, partial [Planctomycetota bacterium]
KDNTSVEYYCTIFAALESPHRAGEIWCGSDDGLLHVTRDDGKTWKNITPPDMPEWAQINSIEAHPTEPGGLYVAATRYKSDDFRPYLFATTDYGKTWRTIVRGIDPEHFTRVIRADPDRAGLLYAGTERGVYVSFNDGGEWEQLKLDLPIVPITDLAVKEKDLIAATQGRGYWILDDLSVLHQWRPEVASAAVHLYTPRDTYRLSSFRRSSPRNMGTNPRSGVVIHYTLRGDVDADVPYRLVIMKTDGQIVRTFTPKPAKKGSDSDRPKGAARGIEAKDRLLETEAGVHRLEWNLRYPDAEGFPGMVLWNSSLRGPRAIPGRYRAQLWLGVIVREAEFNVLPDPRSSATELDYALQLGFLTQLRDDLTRTHKMIGEARRVKKALGELRAKLEENDDSAALRELIAAAVERLEEAEKKLYQTKNRSRQDPLNFPIRLTDKLAGVMSNASSGDFRPTDQAHAVRDALVIQIGEQVDHLRDVFRKSLPAINEAAARLGVPAIPVPEPEWKPEPQRVGVF